MFDKLLSNLPFNPSLITQVSFYAKRLHKETSIRRLGFVFVGLAMAVQLFAAIAPPQPTLAQSSNDIIYGGLGDSPKTKLLRVYDSGTDGRNNDIRAIFDTFHISRADLVNSVKGTINSGDHSLYSLGRNPHSALDQRQYINGLTYYLYLRPLYTWGDNLRYTAFIGSRSGVAGTADDKFFAVMFDCGNIVIKVVPKPQLTPPNKVARTENNLPPAGTTVVPGQTIGYRIFFSNLGVGAAHSVKVVDDIPANATYTWHGSGAADNGGQFTGSQVIWIWNEMPGQRENWYVDLNVVVNADAPNGALICNTAVISSVETPPQTSQQVCHTVSHPPKPTPPPPPPITPQPGQPAISKSKRASNLTQGLNDATTHEAHANDTILYQLITINNGDGAANDYSISENVNDVTEYADVIVAEISDHGSYDQKTGTISWKPIDIKPKTTVTRTFKVHVKDPIPATPRPPSDPHSFDLRMDNVYGNLVSIKLPSPSIAKTVEQTTTTVPNTGPGTNVGIAVGLTIVVGYFFARNRLLAKEIEVVRHEYTTSGGI